VHATPELVVLDRAPLDEAQRAQHLQTAAVAGHSRLEVRVEQTDRAEALVLRVRHHVGAQKQQRLKRVRERRLVGTLASQQGERLLEAELRLRRTWRLG